MLTANSNIAKIDEKQRDLAKYWENMDFPSLLAGFKRPRENISSRQFLVIFWRVPRSMQWRSTLWKKFMYNFVNCFFQHRQNGRKTTALRRRNASSASELCLDLEKNRFSGKKKVHFRTLDLGETDYADSNEPPFQRPIFFKLTLPNLWGRKNA